MSLAILIMTLDIAVHCERDLGSVGELFCSHFHRALVYKDVVGVKGAMVVGVGVRSKDQLPLNDDSVEALRVSNVDEKVEASWNVDGLALDWGVLASPGGGV